MKTNYLTKDIHIRLDEELDHLITTIAKKNSLKNSTLCRTILKRELEQYLDRSLVDCS